MKNKEKNCPKCGAEITEPKAKKCPSCGAKTGKPIFKKWWFWMVVILCIAVIGSAASTNTDSNQNGGGDSSDNNGSSSSTKEYEITDIQQMIDDLNANALKAEKTYQNKYVEITGKIANFDSDGSYISIEAVSASEWNFDTIMCYIKKDSQRDFLMEKSVGDIVTIKGKIISIGEILGYSINIDEVN